MTGFSALVPLLFLVLGAVVVLLLGTIRKFSSAGAPPFVSLAFLAAAAVSTVRLWGRGAQAFGGRLLWDEAGILFALLFLAAAVLTVLLSLRFIAYHHMPGAEFHGLVLLAACGLVIMTATPNLLVAFLGLEIFSVSGYALAGLKRGDDLSAEAAVKYFLTGSFASAFFIFGLALIFGSLKTLDMPAIPAALAEATASPALFLAGLALTVCGLAYKIALVPFHMYQPDVYEGAPTPVSAFFAITPKAAGFAVLIRLLMPYARTGNNSAAVFDALAVIAAATMILANFAALRPTNLKRILAYSSMAQAGYMLVAVVAQDPAGLLFYLVQYLFPGLGAFAVILALGGPGREALELDDLAGLGRRNPWLGGMLAVMLVSLAGFPPTSGFLAKFYVFSSAVRAGRLGLALIGVAASLVSIFYYFRIIQVMFMKEPERDVEADVDNPAVYLVIFLCLFAILQLGLFPGNIVTLIGRAVAAL